ncbi:MAG: 3-hydroxyacyl-ACP dehydratase FabZ, partial [Gammaproteobacteria bacterium]|nr:3-hydroxyacyl-ACP dehydratase FabZ [Gammaproteobacteria bacterium]
HLPHRYPFLLVDKVLDFVPGESLRAVKNVTINEPFFQGHFPHIPVMPGVLIMEALAQATGILSFKTTGNLPSDNSLYYFVGIDKARFRKPVEPGDQLILEVTLERRIRDVWKFTGKALVDGEVVASANLMCAEKELD